MATIARKSDPIERIQLVAPAVPDRLPAMLFLAALIHGILIIGITFNPYILDEFSDAISLEVTIVAEPDQSIDRPDEAEYLAQASQIGGGNTSDEASPSAPLESVSPVDNLGVEDGDSLKDLKAHEQSDDQVLTTQNDQDVVVPDELRDDPQPESATAIALESGSEQTLPLPQEQDATMLIHDDDPRQMVISVDSRESNVAAYLDQWKRRIEAVGDDYFAELGAVEALTGSPTLEVRIEASGHLSAVIIRQSSGSGVVDQAALDILRRASPYDPLPDAWLAEHDRVAFAYTFVFSAQSLPSTARLD